MTEFLIPPSRMAIWQWITVYVHTADENEQMIIEPFHVFVCGPSSPDPPPCTARAAEAAPASSSRYSDSLPTVFGGPGPAPMTIWGPRPRAPDVVAEGLSTRMSSKLMRRGPAALVSDRGVLTQYKSLDLQSWLNDCRNCSNSGVHRAVFPGESHETLLGPPVSLAALVPSTLRGPVTGSRSGESDMTATVQDRAIAVADMVGPHPNPEHGNSSSTLQRTMQDARCSPAVYSQPTESDSHIPVDTPWATSTINERCGMFKPSLAGIEDTSYNVQQPHSRVAGMSRHARTGFDLPVVTLEPAPRGHSQRRKDNSRADKKEAFGV